MPEEPKDFPQSGADGSGQIGKQDWELPNSVSAPPDGFSPNVETASYGGYDESITDYHPPVEQGDIPHPFKVTRYTNEDGEVKVRVRLGRFYYSSSVMTVAKLPPHGPHHGSFTVGETEILDTSGEGNHPLPTHTHTTEMTAGSNHWAGQGDDSGMNGPDQDNLSGTQAGYWPINTGTSDAHDPSADPPVDGGKAATPYFTFTGMGVSGYFEQDVNLGKSIPYSFRLPLGVEPTTLTGQVNEAISDYIEFDSIPEASSVWFRYILEDRDTSIDLANHVGQDVIYVKDVVDSNGNRALPSEHGPLEPLILAQLHNGDNTVPDLVRANPGGWETLPPGLEDHAATFGQVSGGVAGPPPSNGTDLTAQGGRDLSVSTYLKHGCYYIRLASLPPEGDEETYGGKVQQVIHDNIYHSTFWLVNSGTPSSLHDIDGQGFGVPNRPVDPDSPKAPS
tara:strand:- start:5952 stop:7298 length:1347 start_codon:yes stop_codon:yes gene_type:complete